MGADPIVVAVSVVSGEFDGFLVRKAEKQHGTGQRIEGFREKGARVVIVDDVCTTGASTVQAIEAAREFGFEVVGVMCLVEREEAKGRPNVEKAAAPAPFISIFTAKDVRAAASAAKRRHSADFCGGSRLRALRKPGSHEQSQESLRSPQSVETWLATCLLGAKRRCKQRLYENI